MYMCRPLIKFILLYFIYQLMRYSRVCGSYHDNHDRGLLLTRKLLNQGFLVVKLKSSLRKFYGHHNDLVNRQGISVSQMTTYFLRLNHKPLLFSFMTHHRVCNTTGATCAARTVPPFRSTRVHPGY
jgi:hypothetical protein